MNRFNLINKIRQKLSKGEVSIGSWMQIPHSSVAEILGESGFDWIALDLEHASISYSQLPDLCRAIQLGNTLPIVRLLDGTPPNCKQALDSGAGGVIIPMVTNSEQLINLRDSCYWPPRGKRGVGFSRANLFGKYFEQYYEEAQNPLLIAMIENSEAVENLDSILRVKGLDAILIGPYDLSASLGITGDFENDKFIKIIDLIMKKCSKYKLPSGIHIVEPSEYKLHEAIKNGHQFLAYSIDAVMLLKTAKISKK